MAPGSKAELKSEEIEEVLTLLDNGKNEINPIIDWIIQRVNLNGYITRQSDLYEFAEQTGAGKTKFNKWMNKAGLTFDKYSGRWYLKD